MFATTVAVISPMQNHATRRSAFNSLERNVHSQFSQNSYAPLQNNHCKTIMPPHKLCALQTSGVFQFDPWGRRGGSRVHFSLFPIPWRFQSAFSLFPGITVEVYDCGGLWGLWVSTTVGRVTGGCEVRLCQNARVNSLKTLWQFHFVLKNGLKCPKHSRNQRFGQIGCQRRSCQSKML